ncbi:MAG: 5'-nucleotidase C-terminal domain-containing protein [Bacteroidetes bacterium]|nr:5'-nucleotidase C-terminal domain-containing protein [Bacteroidota bacterium]
MYFRLRYLILFSAFISVFACRHKLVVSSVSETHYSIDQNAVDSSLYKSIAPYKQSLEKEMSQVLIQSEGAFTKGDGENSLGNFAADAILFETKKWLGKDSAMADVVILNKGGLRNSLPKGNITVNHMFELMPFENEVVLLKLSAEQFSVMIHKMAEKGAVPMAGIRMLVNNNTPAETYVHGEPYNPTKPYYVITSDYLANGGDSYSFFSNPLERKATGIKVRDMFINYCKDLNAAGKTLKPYLDGRFQTSK